MDTTKTIVGLLGLVGEDAERIGRIVATDVEKATDSVGLQNLEYFLAVFKVRLVAR